MTLGNRERLTIVVKRRGPVCHYCKSKLVLPDGSGGRPAGVSRGMLLATLDHVVPLSRGGTDDFGNLVAACRQCNHVKADLVLGVEWMAVKGRPGGQRI